MFDRIDRLSRVYLGMRVLFVLAFLIVISLGCAMIGWLFPKYDAIAMLQFPMESRVTSGEFGAVGRNVIDLPEYKRVAAEYDSRANMAEYLEATSHHDSVAARRLLEGWENSGSWTAQPVLPISRRDRKDYGELKDAASVALLGLELKASAHTGPIAVEIVNILAGYFTNTVLRERIHLWVVAEKVGWLSSAKNKQADVLRSRLEIELASRRIQEMKEILVRYPEATQMDTRQVITLNAPTGSERFLSPLAQLVGAESSISHRREKILRLNRDLLKGELLTQFLLAAEPMVDQHPDTANLLLALFELVHKTFPKEGTGEEWAREAKLDVMGTLEAFAAMRSQFGIRRDVRLEKSRSRNPLRLALLGAVLGVVLLGGGALLRSTPARAQRELL